ncbi:chaperonin GroEL [Methylomonas methanica]|uniref:60 kDa chaperonin n=1 Tax=Methylomonas methanica (strain DSM 25384 / MC09) TaxID=857087 RepID=G0A1L4_METMM|nr:chaperonin GroEL [Methylomonas methanica]AEG00075.1 chaperonin Cpn60/TCP-1 [Methylomonas methanica MC09]
MSKQVIYNPEARQRLLQGINAVARAAGVTLGSAGPAVMIQHRTEGIMPIFTRDGVTVANAIVMEDRIADLGARMLRDVAGSVSREVGDGTTTAIVLAQSLAADALKSVAAGFHPLQLRKGMELALSLVEQHLKKTALTGVTEDWVEKIALVATKGEAGVGKLLSRALSELGDDGSLTFQLGNGREDQLEVVEGIHYQQGFLSPYFITDKTRGEAVLEQPYILLYDREIDDFIDLVPILEEVAAEGRPLLLIAESVSEKALAGLLLNHVRGNFKVVAVKPPGFGDARINRLSDLALLTGGTAILEAHAPRLEQVKLTQLGQAQRAVINEGSTTVIGAAGAGEPILERIGALRRQLAAVNARKPGAGSPSGNLHEAEELEERIAVLSGKTGAYSVGGTTDVEIKERLVRIENAYLSAKAAVAEGVLPGGGVGLFRCRILLNEVIAENAEQQQGVAIIKNALGAPMRQLLSNGGLNSEEVMMRLCGQTDPQFAFDMRHQRYGHFLDIGIIDSVKVVRLALRKAVSVVGTLISSDTVIMNVPDLSIMDGYSAEWAAATREDPRS